MEFNDGGAAQGAFDPEISRAAAGPSIGTAIVEASIMKERNDETPEDRQNAEDRREFLKKVGKVAVTAPAVALLLSANAKPASAVMYQGPTCDWCWL